MERYVAVVSLLSPSTKTSTFRYRFTLSSIQTHSSRDAHIDLLSRQLRQICLSLEICETRHAYYIDMMSLAYLSCKILAFCEAKHQPLVGCKVVMAHLTTGHLLDNQMLGKHLLGRGNHRVGVFFPTTRYAEDTAICLHACN